MQRIVFNDYVDAGMCALFVAVVLSMIVFGARAIWQAYRTPKVTAQEAAPAAGGERTWSGRSCVIPRCRAGGGDAGPVPARRCVSAWSRRRAACAAPAG